MVIINGHEAEALAGYAESTAWASARWGALDRQRPCIKNSYSHLKEMEEAGFITEVLASTPGIQVPGFVTRSGAI